MKITLISPMYEIYCFGIRSIAAYLEKHDFETQLIFLPDIEFEQKFYSQDEYLYNDSTLNQVVELCHDSNLIGISFFSPDFERAFQITNHLKQNLKTPMIWGGKHASAMPTQALKDVDMVAIGESEITMLDLVRRMAQGKTYYDLKGFWFKNDMKIIKNPVGPLIEDLDKVPILNYVSNNHYVWDQKIDKFLIMDEDNLERFSGTNRFAKVGKVYLTLATRGCPFNCSYCYTYKNLYKGVKYVRRRSVENIMEELQNVKEKYNYINLIEFCDDEFFSASTDYIKHFSELYKKKVGLPFKILGHPTKTNEEKLEMLVDAGAAVVGLGIQTASEKTKKLYKRNISNNQVLQAANTINKFKSSVLATYDFILDNPYETNDDLIETIEFILKLPHPYRLNTFSLTFLPGTKLFEKASQDNLLNSEDHKSYLREFHHLEKTYLNMVFLLVKNRVPKPIIKFLINKKIVTIFDSPAFDKIVYFMISFLRKIKKGVGSF